MPLYMIGYNNGLWIISDSNSPLNVGKYDAAGFTEDLVILGNYAYVSGFTKETLTIVDIYDPNNPTYVGGIFHRGFAEGMNISGDYAYVANGINIVIFDISAPNNPAYFGESDTFGYAYDIAISDNYAHVTAAGNGFLVFRIIDSPPP